MATTGYVNEVRALREAGLSEQDIARATGARRSTVRSWAVGARTPRGLAAERIAELAVVSERLRVTVGSDYLPLWLRKPIPILGDDTPLDVLGRGDYRSILEIASSLEDPGAA